jgi:hypothetical protein
MKTRRLKSSETLETRRRSTLKRLVRKAEGDHKKVEVCDGALSIDDAVVFTFKDGFLQASERKC